MKALNLVFLAVLFFQFLLISPLKAQDNSEKAEIPIQEWLITGSISAEKPLYHDVENLNGGTFSTTDLLHFEHIQLNGLHPSNGDQFPYNTGKNLRWSVKRSTDSGIELTKPQDESSFEIYYLSGYLRVNQWMSVELELQSNHALAVYLDGKRVASKGSFESGNDETGTLKHTLKLERGHHPVLVKVMTSSEGAEAKVKGHLTIDETLTDALNWSVNPQTPLSLNHLMDSPQPMGVSISPDGSITAVMMRESKPDENTWENWIELLKTDTGEKVAVYRGGMQFSGMNWAPQGKKFSYTTRSGGKGTIWVVDLEKGTHEPLIRDLDRLGGHTWAKDGTFIVYSVSEEFKSDGSGVSRLDGMHDRYPTWRNRSFLYKLNLPSGTQERLTAGELSTNLNSISPDGKEIMFSRTIVDYSQRPFTRSELIRLNLETKAHEVLFEAPWVGGAQYSPDGKSLLLTGSPNAFGDLGRTVEGLANDYDSQAYIYNLESKEIKAITRDLKPSVGSASWSHDGRFVFVSTTDKSKSSIYKIDVRSNRIARVNTGVEIADGFSLAENAERAAFVGHGINNPHKVYAVDVRRDRSEILYDPSAESYRNVYFGTSKDWTFTTTEGTEIDGHVYYPVDFDPSGSYPVIVYYYGGTSPVSRAFSGRYPKELYASNGYIVYVLQPSGATGYGQEFSQRHMNDWGKRVSGEIVEGVTAFLEAHPYANKEKVGAIGASFGGFMTKLLLTETDIFATAISHAGISNITSYWGEGYWGYLYSSVASANSFPWDSPDLYVDQSPIFKADKVNTPLLLLHGMSDTNVPPSESIQFYTALKLLGKEVEFVQIENQDHHIIEYNKFRLWKNTIISWFDRWLKDEPAWWEELHE